MRVALYYAPAVDDPLWQRACQWLGRNPETNASVNQPDLPQIAAITASPRLYGFHATLKPPMRLKPSATCQQAIDAAHEVAAGISPFTLPTLQVADLDGFLALRETRESMTLQALCDACVAGLDHLRAPSDEAELARRRRHGLSRAEEAMLTRWGYQHVFATWTFHMTLTRRLDADEKEIYFGAASDWFATALAQPREVAEIAVFTEAEDGAAFLLAERIKLRG
jgi:hypothetical protein